MKRILSLLLALAMCVSLWACGAEEDIPVNPIEAAPEIVMPSETIGPEEELTVEPTSESTTEPTELTSEATTEPTELTTEATTEPTEQAAEETTESTDPSAEPSSEVESESTEEPSTEPETAPTVEEGFDYVLNKNTKKFHFPSCSSASQIKEKNKELFHGTREELIARGYDPCGRCHP